MERYATPLHDVFSRQHKLELEWRVETALLVALAECGLVPPGAPEEVAAVLASGAVTLARTLEIEKETHHDIMAVVKAITEKCPKYGGYVHFGATSQDVNDTVTALQLAECKAALLAALGVVRAHLTRLAEQHKTLATIGRTHGQHAIPITMGFKFANYLYELSVAESFLARVSIVAKFSGAVGTFASLGTAAVQASIMRQLGLVAAPISTQVVSRLHYAEFVFALSAIAAALERLGKEIRNLQRSEINELSEGFGDKQVRGPPPPSGRPPCPKPQPPPHPAHTHFHSPPQRPPAGGLLHHAPEAQPAQVRARVRPGAHCARAAGPHHGGRVPGARARPDQQLHRAPDAAHGGVPDALHAD